MAVLAATATSRRRSVGDVFEVRKRVTIANTNATDEWVDFGPELQIVESAWAQPIGNAAGVLTSIVENKLGTNGAASNGKVGIRAGGAVTVDVYARGR